MKAAVLLPAFGLLLPAVGLLAACGQDERTSAERAGARPSRGLLRRRSPAAR